MAVYVHPGHQQTVKMVLKNYHLAADINVPAEAKGIVLFVSGCGNSRQNPRNLAVSRALNAAGFGTLIFDLLTFEESEIDAEGGNFRFNIDFLAQRLFEVVSWTNNQDFLESLPIGCVGIGIGSAAIFLASEMDESGIIKAIVSRSGCLELSSRVLPFVTTPSLLIVGENDGRCFSINSRAYDVMHCEKDFVLVGGAGHLFEEHGVLQEASKATVGWFHKYLV